MRPRDLSVTLACTVFPYPDKGRYAGIERHIWELSHALMKKCVGVRVITTFWNGGRARDEVDGIEIRRVRELTRTLGRAGALLDLHYWTWGRSVAKEKEFLRGGDLVHAISPLSSAREIRRTGLPMISHFQHYESVDKPVHLLHRPFHHRTERGCYRASDRVITISEFSKRDLVCHFDIPPRRITVIPHGVDLSRYSPASSPQSAIQKPKSSQCHRLLFVGLHEYRKGLPVLMEAMGFLRKKRYDFELVTVGDGPLMGPLKKQARELGISGRVRFTGRADLDGPELPDLYRTSTLFVFPSLKEGFGMVLAEAMASGLPVVASNTSAIPEVVGDCGVLVPPSDPKALARAIGALLDDPERRTELSKMGRKRAEERFNWDRIAERTIKVYEEVLAARK